MPPNSNYFKSRKGLHKSSYIESTAISSTQRERRNYLREKLFLDGNDPLLEADISLPPPRKKKTSSSRSRSLSLPTKANHRTPSQPKQRPSLSSVGSQKVRRSMSLSPKTLMPHKEQKRGPRRFSLGQGKKKIEDASSETSVYSSKDIILGNAIQRVTERKRGVRRSASTDVSQALRPRRNSIEKANIDYSEEEGPGLMERGLMRLEKFYEGTL